MLSIEAQRRALEPLLGLECLHCALNQVINTTRLVGMPEQGRRALMQQAVELLARTGIDRNNCELIDDVYRLVTRALGDEDPYAALKAEFNAGMLRLLPEARAHVRESGDPLAAAVRASIAGNLIDIAALGLDVSMDAAMAKLREVDELGLCIDHCARLAAALTSAETLMVIGDNCGEVALDRLLIETIRELYPQLRVQYGVRGRAVVNDVTRADAAQVGMEAVAEVIDNGDHLLTTQLHRVSPGFLRAFEHADVVIAKGMGNFEGLRGCGREKLFFLMIAKCEVIARLTGAPRGGIVCMEAPH